MLAVLAARAGRQGDDGQMIPRGLLSFADLADDLEAVELRHVDVQEQQIEWRGEGEAVSFSPVAAGPSPIASRSNASRPLYAGRTLWPLRTSSARGAAC